MSSNEPERARAPNETGAVRLRPPATRSETLSPSLLGVVAVLTAAFWLIGRAADGIPGNDGMLLQLGAGLLFYAGAVFLVTMTPVCLLRRETERRLERRFGPAPLNVGGEGVPDPPLSDRAEGRFLKKLEERHMVAFYVLWGLAAALDRYGGLSHTAEVLLKTLLWGSALGCAAVIARGALRGEEKVYRAERGLPRIPEK